MNPGQSSVTCIDAQYGGKWVASINTNDTAGTNDASIANPYFYAAQTDTACWQKLILTCDPPNSYSGMKTDTIRRKMPKVGRNEPCPCGSRLKYKKCCMNKENKHE